MKSRHLLIFILAAFLACKPEISPVNPLPSIKNFSPGTANKGDTVTVTGTGLSGSTIYLDNQKIDDFNNDGTSMSFIIPHDFDQFSSIKVETNRNQETFPQKIILNHTVTVEDLSTWLNTTSLQPGDELPTQKQLLVTDFDNHGIRQAFATTDFSSVLFNAEAPAEASVYIGKDESTSISGGDYFVLKMDANIISDEWWHGALSSDDDLTEANQVTTQGSSGFFNTPNSPIVITENTDFSNLYVNVLLYNSSSTQSKTMIFMKNEIREFSSVINTDSGNGWEWFSIKFSDFEISTIQAASSLNQIKFQWITNGVSLNTEETAFGYVDHIIFTEGNPFLGVPE